jgi:Tol biopolymer transport system component
MRADLDPFSVSCCFHRRLDESASLAFTAMGSKGPDVWIYDLERDTPTQLTFTGIGNLEMAWTPEGN